MTGETTLLRLPSRVEAVNEAAASVARLLQDLGTTDDVSFAVDMAIREAVTNAVLHGNRLDETKMVEVQVKVSSEAVELLVHDEGTGFKPEEVPDPTAAENILKTSGRGIFFIRNFMDEVDWLVAPEGGTTLHMLKRR